MRILIIDTCHPLFLASHYESNPRLLRSSYAHQWRALMDTFFGTADSYSYHLALLGHDAHELVANCRPMQDAWAREHEMRLGWLTRVRSEEETVIAQAYAFEPDVIYVQDLGYFGSGTLARLKAASGFLVGQVGVAPPSARRLRIFDLLVTSFDHMVERFDGLGVPARYLRLGFDPRIWTRLEAEGPREVLYGAVFVGGLSHRRWRTANDVLASAATRTPIDFWGYGLRPWPFNPAVRAQYHGKAWGLEMFRIMRASRIALNRHSEMAGQFANNMRLYEATGVGTMLLTDAKRNLSDLFDIDHELVAYQSRDDLVEKVLFYLDRTEERERVAKAGQERTLREHSYLERMRELASILGEFGLGVR